MCQLSRNKLNLQRRIGRVHRSQWFHAKSLKAAEHVRMFWPSDTQLRRSQRGRSWLTSGERTSLSSSHNPTGSVVAFSTTLLLLFGSTADSSLGNRVELKESPENLRATNRQWHTGWLEVRGPEIETQEKRTHEEWMLQCPQAKASRVYLASRWKIQQEILICR